MLYFIRSGQYVKIGVSANPRGRIASIQTGNPEPVEVLAIVEGDASLEADLHRRLASFRKQGEWFEDCPAVRNEIEGLHRVAIKQRPPPIRRPVIHPAAALPKEDRQLSPPPDTWRFEVKRKPRKAKRRNEGSTAGEDWYYWVIRVHSDGRRVYYGTLADMAATAAAPQEETP